MARGRSAMQWCSVPRVASKGRRVDSSRDGRGDLTAPLCRARSTRTYEWIVIVRQPRGFVRTTVVTPTTGPSATRTGPPPRSSAADHDRRRERTRQETTAHAGLARVLFSSVSSRRLVHGANQTLELTPRRPTARVSLCCLLRAWALGRAGRPLEGGARTSCFASYFSAQRSPPPHAKVYKNSLDEVLTASATELPRAAAV